MGGKRKRLQRPTASLVRPPPTLPNQYNLVPTSATETVPPPPPDLTNANRQPTFRDFPPPKQLFMSSTPGASGSSPSTHTRPPANEAVRGLQTQRATPTPRTQSQGVSASRAAATPEPQGMTQQHLPSQSTPSPQPRTSQSPRSSHAQNSHSTDEDFSDINAPVDPHAPVEPNLSDQQLASLNALLELPRSKHITFLDPDLIEPDSTWYSDFSLSL